MARKKKAVAEETENTDKKADYEALTEQMKAALADKNMALYQELAKKRKELLS
jgi:hypothetical protein